MAEKKEPGCMSTVLAVVLLIGLVIWGFIAYEGACEIKHGPTAQAEAEMSVMRSRAEKAAKGYVLKFLKHPGDASFGFWATPETLWNPAGDTFFLSSTVKAKNDFGAELTYRWGVIVFYNGTGWRLVQCVIDDKTVYEDKALYDRLKNRK